MLLLRGLLLGTCLGCVAFVESVGAQDIAALVRRLPTDSNCLAIVRVDEALASPLAVKEDWSKTAHDRFVSGAGGIPPWVKTLVVGSRVRLSVPEELWSSAIAVVPPDRNFQQISAGGGIVDNGFSPPALRTPRGAYVSVIEPGLLAVRKPAVRQETASWLTEIKSNSTGVSSPYLRQASGASGQLVLAIDLSQTVDASSARQHLQLLPGVSTSGTKLESLTTLLTSLQGVTLTVNVTDRIASQAKIDFAGPVGSDAVLLRDFFVDLLNRSGSAIEEFTTATARADGNSLVLTTPLGDDSLRRIVSLITAFPSHDSGDVVTPPPVAAAGNPPAANVRAAAAEDPVRKASRKYLTAVNKMLEDLQKSNRRATSYEQTATWHERYAKKMEELPIKDVDAALVDYSRSLANEIRGLARSLRGEQVQVNVQQQSLTYNMNYTPGWASVNIWGGVGYGESAYNVESNLQQVRERQAQAVSAGVQQREQIWQIINSQQGAIDQAMRAKFGTDF